VNESELEVPIAGRVTPADSELEIPASRARWFSLLYSKRWVLYAKRRFGGGPQQVLNYLANYTHRVELSNRRIVAFDGQHQTVTSPIATTGTAHSASS
jgi:hypothetical protein